MNVKIKEDAFGRFIIIRADNPFLAWSGARWAPATGLGFPAGDFQISNLATYKDAILYAESFGFTVEG